MTRPILPTRRRICVGRETLPAAAGVVATVAAARGGRRAWLDGGTYSAEQGFRYRLANIDLGVLGVVECARQARLKTIPKSLYDLSVQAVGPHRGSTKPRRQSQPYPAAPSSESYQWLSSSTGDSLIHTCGDPTASSSLSSACISNYRWSIVARGYRSTHAPPLIATTRFASPCPCRYGFALSAPAAMMFAQD